MARPNPKTYPFNYIVHEEEVETECETFVEAHEYVSLNYPEGVHEEYWTTDDGSPLKRLPWSEFADPHKYVWRSQADADAFSRLNGLIEAEKLEEARRFLDEQVDMELEESDDGLDLLAGYVFARTVCSIERRRDAYEAAMEAWEICEQPGQENEDHEVENDSEE